LAASKSDCKAVERFNFLFFRSACHVWGIQSFTKQSDPF
jgi:hypothetical protein